MLGIWESQGEDNEKNIPTYSSEDVNNQTGFSVSTVGGLSLGWSPSPADWLPTVQAPSASREKS